MRTQKFILLLSILILSSNCYPQGFLLSPPKLQFDGTQLLISYDVINKDHSDQFYVWVEIAKKNGEPIRTKAITGDVGEKIEGGTGKKITWIPSQDSVFLNEEVFVEVKAEKYVKSFNKGSMMLLSTAFPGLGQTKISRGKPWWLTGVASYGALAGGVIVYQNYLKTYDSYRAEEDPEKRAGLYTQTQNQMNLSGALIVSGAALWAANVFWVALIPNKYKPLQHVKLSFDPLNYPDSRVPILSLKLEF